MVIVIGIRVRVVSAFAPPESLLHTARRKQNVDSARDRGDILRPKASATTWSSASVRMRPNSSSGRALSIRREQRSRGRIEPKALGKLGARLGEASLPKQPLSLDEELIRIRFISGEAWRRDRAREQEADCKSQESARVHRRPSIRSSIDRLPAAAAGETGETGEGGEGGAALGAAIIAEGEGFAAGSRFGVAGANVSRIGAELDGGVVGA